MLEHFGFMIPVKYLRDTPTLVAFFHPQPAYPLHILIIPKRAIADLGEVRPQDQEFLSDLFSCIAGLVDELGLKKNGYRLIANGGKYQEVAQLHFHLVSDHPLNPGS